MPNRQITPCLWFDGQAEEAAKFYTGIFKSSKIGKKSYYSEAGKEVHKQKPGSVMTVEFELDGQPFTAINGGPEFKFTEATSFQILCDTQKDIDYYWDKLTPGGDPASQVCGWLKDKFGLSWQVIPKRLPEMMTDGDKERAGRVMEALMPMKKIDLAELERAYESVGVRA
jgi:predicted 3-demethylubiquinone-9 3-methyltransferase (glyoxalase superfamily)